MTKTKKRINRRRRRGGTHIDEQKAMLSKLKKERNARKTPRERAQDAAAREAYLRRPRKSDAELQRLKDLVKERRGERKRERALQDAQNRREEQSRLLREYRKKQGDAIGEALTGRNLGDVTSIVRDYLEQPNESTSSARSKVKTRSSGKKISARLRSKSKSPLHKYTDERLAIIRDYNDALNKGLVYE